MNHSRVCTAKTLARDDTENKILQPILNLFHFICIPRDYLLSQMILFLKSFHSTANKLILRVS